MKEPRTTLSCSSSCRLLFFLGGFMLKIKDNVDLKELEKFDFGLCKTKKWNEPDECYKPEYYERVKCKFRDYGKTTYQRIVIYIRDRIIRFYNLSGRTFDKNWANDLIQAGLVEKVGE